MSIIQSGDTVRFLKDDASEAPVKAGQCGIVTHIAEQSDGSTVYTVRTHGKHWLFVEDDLQVLDVTDAFQEAVSELRDLCSSLDEITALYDAPEPVDGVPLEPSPVASPQADADEEPDDYSGEDDDDEDEDDDDECGGCPQAAHYHDENGEPVVLPSSFVVDGDGDKITLTDIRPVNPEAPVQAVARVFTPRLGIALEVHLTATEAVALGEFLIQQFADGAE